MDKYIDAIVLKFILEKESLLDDFIGVYHHKTVRECIDDMPAADVVKIKYGYWKCFNNDIKNNPMCLVCSECRYIAYKRTNYCPHCGADMRGKSDE